ncbi:MAG: glycoside hydrolase family 3 C-terminal domain-containing protein, partial [Promethearchaeota archaeon]
VELTKGVQSKRISTCIKHFAANNQEYNRYKISTEVSERALQEIYYPAFKATVKEADAWSFMACYNRLNGIYGCEHYNLIRETLMDEWKFKGFLVSDWFATRFTDTKGCIKAGLSLEMPFAICYRKRRIKKALEKEEKLIDFFNDNIKRYLRVCFLVGMLDKEENIPPGNRNTVEHQNLALKIAEEGIVLLKNQDNILPLDNENIKSIALIGPNLKKKHSRGGGSSTVRAKYEITPLKGMKLKCKEKRIKITKSLSKADAVVIFAGLSHGKYMDRENKDRIILGLPKEQINLINNCVKQNKKTIVVLIGGNPIEMNNWADQVPGIVMMWYAGMEGGNAIANILFGDVNPSGKLPITFPKNLQDSPAHKSFRTYPGLKDWSSIKEGDIEILKHNKGIIIKSNHQDKVYYEEGIFVGYRYFDTFNIDPLFPFGHGLSYTTFEFENLSIDKTQISGEEEFKVELEVKNTGKRAGSEVVQLYIKDVECTSKRPLKELKGFKKVYLEAGDKIKINFELGKKDLIFFDENSKTWKVENGEFLIIIGNSSRNILLEGRINYIN